MKWAPVSAPTNDPFAGAIVLPNNSGDIAGTNLNATTETGESNGLLKTVWYSWTPSVSGRYRFDLRTSPFAPVVLGFVVSTGSTVSNQSLVTTTQISDSQWFQATAGTTYNIRVGGSAEGFFELFYRPAPLPINDDRANAIVLQTPPNPIIADGTTLDATLENGAYGNVDVWYRFTPAANGRARVLLDNMATNLVAVYAGASGTTQLADGLGFWNLTAGVDYYLRVQPVEGAFRLRLRVLSPPDNDNFGAAQDITGPNAPANASSFTTRGVEGTTVDASLESGEYNSLSNSVWYRWQPAQSGLYRFTLTPFAVGGVAQPIGDFTLEVRSGTVLNSLQSVGTANYYQTPTPYNTNGQVKFSAQSGTTYYIRVSSALAGAKSFLLDWEKLVSPPNDDFVDAQSISDASGQTSGASGQTNGTTVNATAQTGEPAHAFNYYVGSSVWYSYTPATTGRYLITSPSSTTVAAPNVAVYSGSALNVLTRIVADTQNGVNLTGGTTYQIAVTSLVNTAETAFVLRWELATPAPPNDDFANAQVLAAASGDVNGTTRYATKESGEITPATSVWYRFDAPTAGAYKFKLSDTADGTLKRFKMKAYRGAAVNTLTEVAFVGGASDQNRVWKVAANDALWIAIYSEYGTPAYEGDFSLNWQPYPRPANDDFAAAQVLGGNSGTFSNDGQHATSESPETAGTPSLWYQWTPTVSGLGQIEVSSSISITVNGGTFGTGLYSTVRTTTGSALDALTNVPTLESQSSIGLSKISFAAVAGTTYRISATSAGSVYEAQIESGTYQSFTNPTRIDWSVTPPPANDNFAGAQVLAAQRHER